VHTDYHTDYSVSWKDVMQREYLEMLTVRFVMFLAI
jgi:hypothetical protein